MRIKLPASRKGRVWLGVGVAVGLISVVGTISDATKSDQTTRYEMCMKAYQDPKACYEDVYNHNPAQPPSVDTELPAPTDIPTVPSDWGGAINDQPSSGHFYFNPDVPLDPSEVIDLR
jgi:hypothetical protein